MLSADHLSSSEIASLRLWDAFAMESFWRAPVAPMGTKKSREELEAETEPREPVLLLVDTPWDWLEKEF